MTIEERFERIEHVTAGIAEERRKDREEYRELWRGTQGQLDQLAGQVARISADMDRLILESAARDRASQERDDQLGERIASLGLTIGELIRK